MGLTIHTVAFYVHNRSKWELTGANRSKQEKMGVNGRKQELTGLYGSNGVNKSEGS
jgi:hypothetical protein